MSRQAGSITQLISSAQSGDTQAIEQLWLRYVDRVRQMAKKRVAGLPAGGGDEDDVAQSAFQVFFHAAANDNAMKLENRNELWRLLATISRNKATDRVRHELRDRRGGKLKKDAVDLQQTPAVQETPSKITELQDLFNHLMARLQSHDDSKLKHIAVRRLEGASTAEIATELGCVERTVQRKLHILERLWTSDQ